MQGRLTKNGIVYLRRSSGRQETSLRTQLEWAIEKAHELQIFLDANLADLERMQAEKLYRYKSIRLDDAITGADLSRPGFNSIKLDVGSNREISHIFCYRRDRLARPEDAMMMGVIEKEIRQLGVTLVLFEKTVGPRERGQADIADDISMLFEYYESGEFLKKHAERIIASKILLTKEGFWTGGRAPYGFSRVLVDGSGNVVEVLADGKKVRQQSCHVRILPNDQSKLETWVLILDLKLEGLGAKRIAQHLNVLGIPSPDAGRTRTDQGVKHLVSGKWNQSTILDLCRNGAILGNVQLGRRSDGAHRRISLQGPRNLAENDRYEDGRPRLVQNPMECRISGELGFEPRYDVRKWEKIQSQMTSRSTSQRGVPRVKDPTKYPLSTKVVDMTDGCGWGMYARTNGKRRQYVCGRYMSTSGAECEHNSVDAEALLLAILQMISKGYSAVGGRLGFLDSLNKDSGRTSIGHEFHTLELRLDEVQIERDKALADAEVSERRMASEKNDERYEALARQFDRFRNLSKSLSEEISKIEAAKNRVANVDSTAGLLEFFDWSDDVLTRLDRSKLPLLFNRIGMQIGLWFKEGKLGEKRRVRVLTHGLIAFGGRPLPVSRLGKNAIRDMTVTNTCEMGEVQSMNMPDKGQQAELACELPGNDFVSGIGIENSFTKVHRESPRLDWIESRSNKNSNGFLFTRTRLTSLRVQFKQIKSRISRFCEMFEPSHKVAMFWLQSNSRSPSSESTEPILFSFSIASSTVKTSLFISAAFVAWVVSDIHDSPS